MFRVPLVRTPRAPGLFPAALVLALEALTALVLGVLELASTRADRPVVGITTGLVFLGYGAVLVLTAGGIRVARRWARGLAVCTQVLHLPIAYSFFAGNTWWVAAALVGAAAIVLVGVLLPSSTAAFLARRRPHDGGDAAGEEAAVTDPPGTRAGATPRKR